MPLSIVRNNIVNMDVDAVVNAANSRLLMGSGVCGAIFDAAGPYELQRACDKIGHCPTGSAVITPGFRLKAKYVIHAVGPVWEGGASGEEALLRSAYAESLKRARENGCESIAFPLISSGVYGYPKDQALHVALSAIQDDLLRNDDLDVYLVVFDRSAFMLSEKLFRSVRSYVDEHYVAIREKMLRGRSLRNEPDLQPMPCSAPMAKCCAEDDTGFSDGFDFHLRKLEETFSESVLRIIDQKGIPKDSIVYKRANLDKSVFSKLRSNPAYAPSKSTAVALAIALELNMDQTCDLLRKAGFALSPSNLGDVIVSYFIESGLYDIFEINAALFQYDQPCLGAKG